MITPSSYHHNGTFRDDVDHGCLDARPFLTSEARSHFSGGNRRIGVGVEPASASTSTLAMNYGTSAGYARGTYKASHHINSILPATIFRLPTNE